MQGDWAHGKRMVALLLPHAPARPVSQNHPARSSYRPRRCTLEGQPRRRCKNTQSGKGFRMRQRTQRGSNCLPSRCRTRRTRRTCTLMPPRTFHTSPRRMHSPPHRMKPPGTSNRQCYTTRAPQTRPHSTTPANTPSRTLTWIEPGNNFPRRMCSLPHTCLTHTSRPRDPCRSTQLRRASR